MDFFLLKSIPPIAPKPPPEMCRPGTGFQQEVLHMLKGLKREIVGDEQLIYCGAFGTFFVFMFKI